MAEINMSKDGFLDSSFIDLCKKGNEYTQEFDYAKRLNAYIYKIIIPQFVDIEKPCQYITDYCVSNFILIHKAYQSILILLEKGLLESSMALIRILLEELFHIKALNNDLDVFENIKYNYYNNKMQTLNHIRSGQSSTIWKANYKEILEQCQKEKERLEEQGKKKLNIEDAAKKAQMKNDYKEEYKYLCSYVHPNIERLLDSLDQDSEEFLHSLLPKFDDTKGFVYLAIHYVILSCEAILEHFSLSTEELNKWKKEAGDLFC